MRIYNNVNATNAQNSLATTNMAMSKSLEKLSTGLRINRAADDAAGLSVSEGLRSQIRGSQTAQRNSNDSLAMLQIAESGTQEITNSLQRMRELAIQSSNGTYTNTDRSYIQAEFTALKSEITRIAQSTTYNGVDLLSTTSTFSFQVSAAGSSGNAASSSTISFSLATNLAGDLSLGAVSTQSAAQSAINSIDTALTSVLSMRSDVGAAMNRLEKTVSNLGVSITNMTDAESRIRDTDFATETTKFTRNQILTNSAQSMLAQANQLPQGVMSLLR
ncbi:MAG: flagellin FliC [Fibrobacteria bacterium]|nr:flagellin FliC [Fibrobacteria bacterium]